MILRELNETDAPYMLEWMHDKSVVKDLPTDFASKTEEDCYAFIAHAKGADYLHMAVASDEEEYMGTVSLKHIDIENGSAEFAIAMRVQAMGRGYAWFGMCEMLKLAFEKFKLQCVYWCVSDDNKRACRFYEKHGFHEVCDVPDVIAKRYKQVENLRWYSVLVGDDYQNRALSRQNIAGCRIVSVNTIPTVNAGELSFFESNRDVAFDIKRIYYISKVPEGMRRGYHAHKTLKQFLFCPYGKIQLILDDGNGREEITLDDPSIGILIDSPVWREMLWLEKDSVLCVVASEYYDPDDYIRDYEEFKRFVEDRVTI